jgi:hypothetical protein
MRHRAKGDVLVIAVASVLGLLFATLIIMGAIYAPGH